MHIRVSLFFVRHRYFTHFNNSSHNLSKDSSNLATNSTNGLEIYLIFAIYSTKGPKNTLILSIHSPNRPNFTCNYTIDGLRHHENNSILVITRLILLIA